MMLAASLSDAGRLFDAAYPWKCGPVIAGRRIWMWTQSYAMDTR